MFEIGHGIEVYYENKKEKRNIVFFPENTYNLNYSWNRFSAKTMP